MILWDRKTIKASLTRPEAAVLIVMIKSKILNWNFRFHSTKRQWKSAIYLFEKTDSCTIGRWTSYEIEQLNPFSRSRLVEHVQCFARTHVCLESKLQLPG